MPNAPVSRDVPASHYPERQTILIEPVLLDQPVSRMVTRHAVIYAGDLHH
jgi:hypothetical protein